MVSRSVQNAVAVKKRSETVKNVLVMVFTSFKSLFIVFQTILKLEAAKTVHNQRLKSASLKLVVSIGLFLFCQLSSGAIYCAKSLTLVAIVGIAPKILEVDSNPSNNNRTAVFLGDAF